MEGLGVDELGLVILLTHLRPEERRLLRAKYRELFGDAHGPPGLGSRESRS